MDAESTYLTTSPGQRIFLRWKKPAHSPKALVLLTHGMGEHSGRYSHVADFLAERGYEFYAYDLRGHGRSTGRRGHIDTYDDLLNDLDAVLTHVRKKPLPIFLYGHSLGGQIVINFLLKRDPSIAGAVIASPWLRLAFKPHALKLVVAKILMKIWPTFTQHTTGSWSRLSRDQNFILSMQDLDLVHRRMSARMYYELTVAAADAMANADKVMAPLLLIHGHDDAVTSCAATEEFHENCGSPDATLMLYPNMLHETHNELDREAVLRDVVSWLDKRCG